MSKPHNTQTHTAMTNADKQKQAQNTASQPDAGAATPQEQENTAATGPGPVTLEKRVGAGDAAYEQRIKELEASLATATSGLAERDATIQKMTVQLGEYEKLTKDGVIKQPSTAPVVGALQNDPNAAQAPIPTAAGPGVPVHQTVQHQGTKSEQIVEVGSRPAEKTETVKK